jgi:hypothetical protein
MTIDEPLLLLLLLGWKRLVSDGAAAVVGKGSDKLRSPRWLMLRQPATTNNNKQPNQQRRSSKCTSRQYFLFRLFARNTLTILAGVGIAVWYSYDLCTIVLNSYAIGTVRLSRAGAPSCPHCLC